MIIKELKFPTVYDQGKAAGYGGDQEWFSLSRQRKAGCGCTSGANLAIYYASARPGMAGIYDGNCEKYEKKDYVRAMEKMYAYMTPGIIGFPYVKKFARQFIKFCKDYGIEAEAEFCNKFAKKEEAVCFIQEGIDRGDPVDAAAIFKGRPARSGLPRSQNQRQNKYRLYFSRRKGW